ncbi:MAG TPA: hypothetical protein VEN81_06860, partial [Planctomycetota bacterium]|nr:hypothetical protein [Planctomycetota bacterium]
MRLVFCLLALGASAQEARLDDVLELMEKRTRGVQDLKVTIVTRAERAIGLPHSQVTVAWVRDAGLRVRGRFQPEADGRNFGLRLPRGIDVIYTADRIRLIQDWDDRPGMGGLAFQALAIRTDDPAFKSHDPMLLPTSGYPIRMMVDEPIVYAQMAPRLMLGMEPNLALEGKRMEGSRSCFVLVSSPAPRDPKLPRPGYFVQSRRKQFFVDAQSGSLVKIRWELSFSINLGGAGLNEQRMVFQSEVQGEQNVVGGFSLPESIRWSARLEGRGMGGGGDLVRGIAPGRVNAGLAPAGILTAAEKDDLYGDAVLRRAEDYEAMVRKDPGDAEAHYALAQCRGAVDPLPAMVPGG